MSGTISKSGLSAILDTNLVLLFLVAKTDSRLLERYKRVQTFTDRDIRLLEQLLRSFEKTLTTPQILTEVSNLLGQAPADARRRLMEAFTDYILLRREVYVPSEELTKRETFLPLGLADSSLEVASLEHTIITTDYRLAGKIKKMGGQALNFNNARGSYLLPWK